MASDLRETGRLARVFAMEGLCSFASNILTISIFFYTRERLNFTTRQNLIFSSLFGAIYIVAALLSHRVVVKLGVKRALSLIGVAAALFSIVPLFVGGGLALCIAVCGFVLVLTMSWPILEHLVATGEIDSAHLVRRITIYNLTWSSTGAAAIAVGGWLIEHHPSGVFLVPAALCAGSAAIAAFSRIEPNAAAEAAHASIDPDPQLLRQRNVAMMLARISLPAMYVVAYALAAMMPSLSVLQAYSVPQQTVISSVWFAVRFLMFALLGVTHFWATRPRLLLIAGAGLLAAFLLIVVPLSGDPAVNLTTMLTGQVLLGICAGLIYMCSLYFGMALTRGSAESGGYHEALIGMGMTVGPAAGATLEFIRPHDQPAAVAAVATILGATILTASVMSLRQRSRKARTEIPV